MLGYSLFIITLMLRKVLMKYFLAPVMAVLLFLSGCASSVVTYDSEGKMIGKCEAKKGFILGAGVGCSGTANQEGKGK